MFDDDDFMEQDELEAILAYEEQQQTNPPRPSSPSLSEDDYDEIFAELISQEQSSQPNQNHPMEEVEMTDGMDMMSQ